MGAGVAIGWVYLLGDKDEGYIFNCDIIGNIFVC